MSLRPPARRRLAPWLLVALGMLGLVALGLVGRGQAGWGLFQERAPTSKESAPELEAARAPEEPRGGPRLEPAPGATPRATHGPVVVRVLDLQGRPCAGVRFEAWIAPDAPEEDPQAEDTTATYEVRRVTCDAFGQARFDDLPYDGHAKVRALARLAEDAGAESALAVVTTQVPVLQKLPVLTIRFNPPTEGSRGTLAPEPGDPRRTPEDMEHLVAAATEAAWTTIVEPPPPGLLGEVVVEGPEVTLTIDAGLPLLVEVREGGTGRLRRDAATRVWPRLAWEAPTVGETRVVAKPGSVATLHCRVEAPEGWIARKEAEWTATIHPLATRLEAVYPLRPALDVIVELPQEVMPYRTEDWNGTIMVAGIPLEAPLLRVDAEGRLHVRGGSYLVGDQVEVSGSLGKRWIVGGVGYIGPDPRQPVRVVAEVRPLQFQAEEPIDMNEAEGDPAFLIGSLPIPHRDASARQQALWKVQVTFDRLLGRPKSPSDQVPSGPLTLRVVAWDGAAAAGARVRWQDQERVADAQGRVRLEGVPPGTHRVQVLGAGAPLDVQAEVGPGPRGEVLLRANAGGTLQVEVLDTLGRVLPYAHVDLVLPGDQPHMDCVDGVQRLDPYTDAAGRRTYRFVPPGLVKVKAYFGTRNAEVQVEVAEGVTVPVSITLPVHAPPPPPPPVEPAPKGE